MPRSAATCRGRRPGCRGRRPRAAVCGQLVAAVGGLVAAVGGLEPRSAPTLPRSAATLLRSAARLQQFAAWPPTAATWPQTAARGRRPRQPTWPQTAAFTAAAAAACPSRPPYVPADQAFSPSGAYPLWYRGSLLGRLVCQALGIKGGNGRILGHAVRDRRGGTIFNNIIIYI